MKSSHTPGPISFDGWFPPRENGLLPSLKANWDGRMLQLFTQDLEQGEIDMRLLQSAPDLLEACKAALGHLETELQTTDQYCFNWRFRPDLNDPKCECVICKIKTAIAKAS